MKRGLILSILLNVLLLVGILILKATEGSKLRAVNQQFQIEHYRMKTNLATHFPQKTGSIVFLGDSQIEYCNWNELLGNKNILNRGIAGDVTAGLIGRIDEICRHQPSKIFIEIGTNDLSMDIAPLQIIDDFGKLVALIKAQSEAKIFINSVLPVQDLPFEGFQNAEILALNRQLKAFCAAEKLTFIELDDIFADENGNLKAEFTHDGLHLTAEGYVAWAERLKQYL
jgi:lysophospholipase L1-like esterase